MTLNHDQDPFAKLRSLGLVNRRFRRYPASDAEDHKFSPFWRGDADEADQASGADFWVQTLNKSCARDGLLFNACRPMMLRSKKKKWVMVGRVFRPESIMRRLLADFLSSESGATAIEYGLIAVGISVTIVTAVTSVGNTLKADLAAAAAAINP